MARRTPLIGTLALIGLLASSGCASMKAVNCVHRSDDGKVEVWVSSKVSQDGSLQSRQVQWIAQPDRRNRCERIVTATTDFGPDGTRQARTVEKRQCGITESRTTERWDEGGAQIAWEVAVDVDHDGEFDFEEQLPGPNAPLRFAQIRDGVAPDL